MACEDKGPIVKERRMFRWSLEGADGESDKSGEIELLVAHRVDYPSVYHRGHGLDPSVAIPSIQSNQGRNMDLWMPTALPVDVHQALHEQILEGVERELSLMVEEGA